MKMHYPAHHEGLLTRYRGMAGYLLGGEFVPLPMGGGSYGTLATLDTLASTQQSIAQYDEDRAFSELAAALVAHNAQMNQIVDYLCERSQDRQRRYGSAASKVMQVADQFGRPQGQKVTAGVTLGFPLRLYEDALQWTRKFMQTNGSAMQLAAEFDAILDADRRQIMFEVKSALLAPTNYTFHDVLVDNVSLAVKRLANADGAAIPLGPNGESFDGSSHTHYLYTAGVALAAADLSGLISTVLEHSNRGTIEIWINTAQETAVRGLSGFVADIAAYIVRGGGATSDVTSGTLDIMNPQNRRIGMFGAAEVWVKPWMPSGYLVGCMLGGAQAPLVMRTRAGNEDLQLVFDDEAHPLRARGYEREFGIGVYNRVSAAALYIDSGAGGAYVSPTLTV